MKCRLAEQSDLNVLKELWYECFLEHDSKESIDFYFEYVFDLEHTFVLEVDNEIVTSLQLNQHQLYLNEKVTPVSFVVGVATFNKHRKKGYMRILLEYALNYAKEVYKQRYIILQAYNWDVYRPFGFKEYYYKSKSILDLAELEDKEEVLIEEFNPKNLLEIYNQYTSNLNGYALRDEDYFILNKRILEIDGVKIAQSKDAYLFYERSNNELIINECAFKTKASLLQLISKVKGDSEKITLMSDCLNFQSNEKELFMMIKDLEEKEVEIVENLYISEWI